MFDPMKFTTNVAKPFPVFLLLDVSGSMDAVIDPENTKRTGKKVFDDGQEWEIVEGGTTKIQLLNDAVRKMIASFKLEEKMETKFLVSIITFGDTAQLHLPPTRASEIKWNNLSAYGKTALGATLRLAKEQIENKEVIPSRAYRPTVVLVSDGVPNDDWKPAMKSFVHEGRSSKCFCVAMGIGDDADMSVLNSFIKNTPYLAQQEENKVPNKVFHADDAEHIHEFFEKVTMTVTTRSNSSNPNLIPSVSKDMDDDGYW